MRRRLASLSGLTKISYEFSQALIARWFQGFAVGADIGFFDELFSFSSRYNTKLISVNAAASVGNEIGKFHINIAQFFPVEGSYSYSVIPSMIQIGTELKISRNSTGGGLKFIAETLVPIDRHGLEDGFVIIGFRITARDASVDFGWPFLLETQSMQPSQVPFFSFNFFL